MCGIPGERVHTSPHPSGDDCRSLPRPNNNNASSTGRATTLIRTQFTTDVKQGTAVGDDVPHRILHLNSPLEQLTADARSRRLYRIRQPAGHRLDPSTCDTHTDTTVEAPFGVPPQRSPTLVSQAEGVYPGPQPLSPSTSRKVRCTRAQGLWTRVYVAPTPCTRESGYFTPSG